MTRDRRRILEKGLSFQHFEKGDDFFIFSDFVLSFLKVQLYPFSFKSFFCIHEPARELLMHPPTVYAQECAGSTASPRAG